MKRRRYIGLAAFIYAVLHLSLFLIAEDLEEILESLTEVELLLGWLAFMIMLPLAVTSNDTALRKLGPKWKAMQRWVYLAVVAVALHWALAAEEIVPVLIHFTPLALLEGYRLFDNRRRKVRRAAA